MTRLFALVLIVLTIGAATAAHSQDNTITVFAAASMTNALDDANVTFSTRTGIKVVAHYGSSSALIKQIEGSAPADAFVSASRNWMDYGVEKKVINESTRINLFGNVLVLIAAKDSRIDHVDIKPGFDLAKLAGDGRIATGDVKEVPVGRYAKAALEKLGVWSSRRAENGYDGRCPGRSGLRRPRRGAAWHCLRDRCQDRVPCESHRRLPREFAQSDRLSGGGDGERRAGDDAIPSVSAVCGDQSDVRGLRLLDAGKADVLNQRVCEGRRGPQGANRIV